MLIYRCLAAVFLSLVFAVEVRHYFASLPLLNRLRLRHLTDWSQALKLPPSRPPMKRDELCESDCKNLSVGVTPCCGTRRCGVHTKDPWCCELWLSTRKPRKIVNESRPKVSVERCQMPTKPPKPRCRTCKLGLIICVDHQTQCRNPAFSACNFCLRYCCETGDCKTKICCVSAAARVKEVAEGKSQLRAVQADRCESTPVARLSLKAVRDDVAVPVMPSPADAPALPLIDAPAKVRSPADVAPLLPLLIDAPAGMPSTAVHAPALSLLIPVKMRSPAAIAPVLPLPMPLTDAPVKMRSPAAITPALPRPVPNLRDPAADIMTMRARPVSGSPHSNCQSPLTDRRHSCANCASLGQWCTCSRGNRMTKRTQSLRSASAPLLGRAIHLKSSGGSREPTEAQKITPVPFSPDR
jgi:hypothetical protein